MVWYEIGALVGLPILRNVVGWANNALQDNKVTEYEWKQLFGTVLRVGTTGLVAYFGLNASGFEIDALTAGAAAYLFDLILSWKKK